MNPVRRRLPTLALAAIAYVPLVFTARGRVGADTKTYLYLDPARLLTDAPSMWDPGTGLGTVTHQTLGYLFPMGPYFWLCEQIGLPDWLAQRLWLGTILLAAGTGVRFLLRQMGWVGPGRTVAALAYMLSPYLLAYSARISVILLPWAALPWLIGLCIRSVRNGGWRDPARFALVILLVGGVNATALVLVGLGPLLWFVYAAYTEPDLRPRQLLGAIGRIGLLTAVTSLWWLSGLWAQGGFGIPILRYTETYRTVAEVSAAQEVLRGLGYWFFYGRDKLGPWIEPGGSYTTNMWVLLTSFTLPVLALASAALVRWRHRAFFAALVAVGGLSSVAAHPWDAPSPAGSLFKKFATTDAGLALRSTPRAAPLLVLGMAVFLGMGVNAVSPHLPRLVPSAGIGLLIVLNLPALWTGQMVAENLQRSEDIPSYWLDAADHLDSGDHSTRVLEIPGSDFASYRWGNTVDPITPGLIDRSYVARELIPYGGAASAAMLNALDRPLQEGTFDERALAPIARLMGVGDILLRSDLQYERFGTPRPRPTWALLQHAPGLDPPRTFGDAVPNVAGPEQPLLDDQELGLPVDLGDPPPVAVFGVRDPRPIIRAEVDPAVVIAGDAAGLVAAAGAGLLVDDAPVRFAATLAAGADRPPPGAPLVVTDSNRRAANRWGTIRENLGYTEPVGEEPLVDDPNDNRLDVFPDTTDDSRTVAIHAGGASASATGYGNPVSYTAEDRAVNAVDGDPTTAWRVGAFSDVTGERLLIELDDPSPVSEITLLQPTTGVRTREVTDIILRYGDGESQAVTLGKESTTEPGQQVALDAPIGDSLEIEIRDTDIGRQDEYDGQSAVGFAEVRIGDLVVEEQIRPPRDLLAGLGEDSLDHDLTLLFTRIRSRPDQPVRSDPEPRLVRVVALPVARTFSLAGTARLSAVADEDTIATLAGLDGPSQARSSGSLQGDLASGPWAAFDGDDSTAWQTPFLGSQGRWLELSTDTPVRTREIELTLVDDGRHSQPTRLSLEDDSGATVELTVPDGPSEKGRRTVRLTLPQEVSGRRFRLGVVESREIRTRDWYGTGTIPMPVGIAEMDLGQPVLEPPDPGEPFDSGCRDDLLTIDGEPYEVRVTGTTGDLLDLAPLAIEGCGGEMPLSAGDHILRSAPGRVSGINVDQIELRSLTATPAPARARPPQVTVVDDDRTSAEVEISSIDGPFWLVLGQSHNDGWTATIDGGDDLGPPTLIDGYANGWLVDPEDATTLTIHLRWWPQRVVNVAIVVSAIFAVLCVLIAVRRRDPNVSAVVDRPRLVRILRSAPSARSTRAGVVLAALAGAFVLAVSPSNPWVIPTLVLSTAAAMRPTARQYAWLAIAAVYAALAGAVVLGQFLGDNRADFDWVSKFEFAHAPSVMVLALIGVLAVLEGRELRESGRAGDGEQHESLVVDVVGEREVGGREDR